MRFVYFTLLLVLAWLSGCSQQEKHNFGQPGRIPIDASRWYVLNNSGNEIRQLFNGITNEQLASTKGRMVVEYEAWYPLIEGEEMTIDSIEMFDWEGTNDHPTSIFAVLRNWQRVPLATFTGQRYNKWNGPDPEKPDDFALTSPVSGIRYIIIDTWGELPTEIEFYGKYTKGKSTAMPQPKPQPLKNYFGINGFEWNFEDAKNPTILSPPRLNAMKSFTALRHYLDWEKIENKEGHFSFNPSRNGSWNYDTMYAWCKNNDIEVLVCFKNAAPWILESYPEYQKDNENIPVRYGKNFEEPASYVEQAKAVFQFTARYGNSRDSSLQKTGTNSQSFVDFMSLIKVDTTPRWNNDTKNKIKTGLGLIKYIECGNETDKWWKGRKAYQTGREYAANLSAFYDGHKNTLGPGVGVKNADPSVLVVMGGLANPTPDYVKGIIDWCKEFRGMKPDGRPDLPFDIINYHYYSCEYSSKVIKHSNEATGVAPELSNTDSLARNFVKASLEYVFGLPVWVTETGYDVHQGSPQRAIPIGEKSAYVTQADWVLRTSLLYAKTGIQKLFFYELYDDNGTATKYGTAGLIDNDFKRRPAADFLYQTNQLFGQYTFDSSISTHPVVDRYKYKDSTMYVLYLPDQSGKISSYLLNLAAAKSAIIYTPKLMSDTMDKQLKLVINNNIDVKVTETPVFLVPVK